MTLRVKKCLMLIAALSAINIAPSPNFSSPNFLRTLQNACCCCCTMRPINEGDVNENALAMHPSRLYEDEALQPQASPQSPNQRQSPTQNQPNLSDQHAQSTDSFVTDFENGETPPQSQPSRQPTTLLGSVWDYFLRQQPEH